MIVNLIAKKTVEDHLIKILEKKLDLFKNTIGELETILGYMTSENDPESFVMEAFVDSYGKKKKLKKLDSSLTSSIKKVDESLESSFAKSGIDLRPENLNNIENIKFFNDGGIVELAFCEFLDKYNCLKDSDDFELKFTIPHFLKEGSSRFFPELIRGKSGRIIGNYVALFNIMKGLPLAYSKDMQEDKEPLFDSIETTKLCLLAMVGMIDSIKYK